MANRNGEMGIGMEGCKQEWGSANDNGEMEMGVLRSKLQG